METNTDTIVLMVGFVSFLIDLVKLINWMVSEPSKRNSNLRFRKWRKRTTQISIDRIILIEEEFIEHD